MSDDNKLIVIPIDGQELKLSIFEIVHLLGDGRCTCGHLSVFHHYCGGDTKCVICGCVD